MSTGDDDGSFDLRTGWYRLRVFALWVLLPMIAVGGYYFATRADGVAGFCDHVALPGEPFEVVLGEARDRGYQHEPVRYDPEQIWAQRQRLPNTFRGELFSDGLYVIDLGRGRVWQGIGCIVYVNRWDRVVKSVQASPW